MKTVKHYNVELEINENKIEYGTTKLKFEIENIELLNIKIVSLPRAELVGLIEFEVGKKSLKWFEGLFNKLEKAIIEIN
ncbi:hypothetical protein NYE67_20545 [Solibacillus sp. FSL W8-0474]|uniref:hypothetical protein n=1 Tax=Solibacillus sp. FSL W8-0474 TaxID=2975336 RepID=UPI0030F9BA74